MLLSKMSTLNSEWFSTSHHRGFALSTNDSLPRINSKSVFYEDLNDLQRPHWFEINRDYEAVIQQEQKIYILS